MPDSELKEKFAHLHVHSHYSLLNALPQIGELVKFAKKNSMKAIALTDAGNMYGAIEFYKECQKQEIKPIIGVDFYVSLRTRHDREARIDNKRTRLILLAKDLTGYKNLIKLVTISNLEGFYYKPRIDRELFQKYKEGLICIAPSFSSDIAYAAKNNDTEKVKELISFYKQSFSEDFFIEITHHAEVEHHEETMERLISIAKETDTQIVAAHDVYYLQKDDKAARETLMSISNEFGGERAHRGDPSDFSFIDADTAVNLFEKTPEAISNTQIIVDRCNLEIPLGKWLFPHYELPEGMNADDELRRMVLDGLNQKVRDGLMTDSPEAHTRLEYELDVIKTKGYAPYFLVVADLLRHAHENGILTNIRGSVAGSIVTYLSDITSVNPLEYKLPFERFLNPMRPSAPDIDMDYADNRRDEMISYARQKYGQGNVAQIGTFGTMAARGAVRDVARALGHPYAIGDRIAKLIPMGSQGFPMTIDHAIEITPELKKAYEEEDEVQEVIDMAKKIEGLARHISVHAAGVVISPVPLNDIVPVQFDPKGEGKIITQYDMHYVDENSAGLLKFDFLGLRNLAILADAIRLTEKITGQKINIEKIPVNDVKTFEMLARGETMGVFQLAGTGMTKHLIDLKPSTIHDINAMVALYRPGPMEMIPEYVRRKHNAKLIKFLDPRMKDILDFSYGVITYQDDVMLIAIHLAGYSWLEADALRKAMGKKIPAVMAAEKDKLHDGLIAHGMSEEKAEELWALIEPFAAYGFNKAHAASYGRLAYQTAYMKANFPAIYMAAALTAETGNIETIAEYISECKRMGIPVLPPDVNESFKDFTVVKTNDEITGEEKDAIRFGLYTIKNFGENIAEVLIKEREENGKFTSLEDFLSRIKDRNLNKKSVEALIKTGALDEYEDRGIMIANLEELLAYNKESVAHANTGHDSLFGGLEGAADLPKLKLAHKIPAKAEEKLLWEKELLGLYISGHPLDKHKEKFAKQDLSIKKLLEDPEPDLKKEILIGGLIEEAREVITKKGTRMMFVKLADMTGSIEAVVFPKIYDQFKSVFQLDACVAVKGKLSDRNGSLSIMVDKAKVIE